jgi:hypothetical protein
MFHAMSAHLLGRHAFNPTGVHGRSVGHPRDVSPQQCSLPFSTPKQISGLDLPGFFEQHTRARSLVYEWL